MGDLQWEIYWSNKGYRERESGCFVPSYSDRQQSKTVLTHTCNLVLLSDKMGPLVLPSPVLPGIKALESYSGLLSPKLIKLQ